MVSVCPHICRARIGIQHADRCFARQLSRALPAPDCVIWHPEDEWPPASAEFDIVIVTDAASARRAFGHWSPISVIMWGRPEGLGPDGSTRACREVEWDGWLASSLTPRDAADLLGELLASGLITVHQSPASSSALSY